MTPSPVYGAGSRSESIRRTHRLTVEAASYACATRQTLAAVTDDTVDGTAFGSLAPVKVTGGNPHITVSAVAARLHGVLRAIAAASAHPPAGLCGVQHEASRWRRATFPGQPAS